MITVKLLGGMGNQLFQWAYAQSLLSRGYQVRLNKDSLVEGTHREYSLGFLGEQVFGDCEGLKISEPSMRFNEECFDPPLSSTMVGYWQAEKYFKNIEDDIRAEIQRALWPQKTTLISSEFANSHRKIYSSISIGVHVRRQDYVHFQSFHGMPSVDYYLAAVKQIQCQTLSSKVFVFSDDPGWCLHNLPKDWDVAQGTNKYEDLRLMTCCKHMVIANSSFSWWGAWLGDYTGTSRIVVAPKQWFADPGMQEQSMDICPERWIRI